MRLPFGPWEPDSAGLDMRDPSGAALMSIANGVWPAKAGYIPIPALIETSTHTLPAACLGMFVGHSTAGGHVLFVGTTTKLYKYDSANGWLDYTRVAGGDYAVPSGEYWQFCQFGSLVIACNIMDNPQVIDIDTGAANFSLLAGSPPKSRYPFVVGDFVVLANQQASPRRVTNSAINDATGWTVGTLLCDQQDFPDGEEITGVAGGEFGWIAQEHALRRMIFQPGFDQAFRFERVEREHGNCSYYALNCVGSTIYYPSDDGFYSFSADKGLTPIGHQRVNDWFRANSDTVRKSTVLAVTDPFAPRVGWAFSNPSSTYLSHVLWYDWSLDQWSYMEQVAQFWSKQVTAAISLESLDPLGTLETLPFPLDSRVWSGGLPVIAGITSTGRLAFLSGAVPMNATLLTAPMQLTPSARSFVKGVFPIGIFNDVTVTVRVGRREHSQNPVSYTVPVSPSTKSGIARLRAGGRLHQVELALAQSSGTVWNRAEGLDIESVPDGLQ